MSRPSSLLLFFLSIVVSATATVFSGCEPVSCGGNGSVNITYPFRAIDGIVGQASYCSRDDLKMFCLDGFPALTISSKNYTVLDINSSRRTITVVESTVRKSHCPKSLANLNDLSYPLTHFRVASTNINLTFLSACSSSSSPKASLIRCLNSSVYLGDKNKSIEQANGSLVGCNTSLFPVMNRSIDWTKGLGVQFVGLMKKGFQLEWYPPLGKDCRVCERYHGRCGSRYTEKGFIFACYCSDEVTADYCGGRRLLGAQKMGRNQLFPLRNQKMGISTCLSLLGVLCFVVEIAVAAAEFQKERCTPRSCGKGTTVISYPFWITDLQGSYCGYSSLGVNCNGEVPVLAISDAKYDISQINYNSKTVVFQLDLTSPPGSNSSCVDPSRNLTFGTPPFRNCSNMTQEPHGYFDLPCSGEANKSYVGNHNITANVTDFASNCSEFLPAPFAEMPGMNIRYTMFLNGSIELNWSSPDCNVCIESGGYCGYDNITSGFVCLCSDRVHQVRCQKEKRNVPLKVVIGICSSLGGFILAFICFCYCYKHKHTKRTSSLTKSFRNSSSKHASMEYDSLSSPCHGSHIFSYNELQVATDGFASYNELGDGGFGTVYKGKLRDGRTVAIKRLYENSYKRVEQFNNEVSILNRLRHHNLVTLYGSTSHQSRELLLVYEYISNGTVADHLHGVCANEGALTWSVRMNIAIETAQALSYLHAVEPPIIHRDVKTNNILLDKNFHVKVADFGLSRLFPPDVTHVSTVPQGTPGYVDPEYYQCYKLTDKSDVYSFGVVLVELISSKPAVDVNRHRHEINLSNMAINKIQNSLLHELVDVRLGFDSDRKVRKMIESVAEVAFRCLQSEKEMRPTIKEVHEQLEDIVNRNYDDEQSDDPDVQINDDTSLLKDPVQFSPNSVAVPWASRSTTPNTSE